MRGFLILCLALTGCTTVEYTWGVGEPGECQSPGPDSAAVYSLEFEPVPELGECTQGVELPNRAELASCFGAWTIDDGTGIPRPGDPFVLRHSESGFIAYPGGPFRSCHALRQPDGAWSCLVDRNGVEAGRPCVNRYLLTGVPL